MNGLFDANENLSSTDSILRSIANMNRVRGISPSEAGRMDADEAFQAAKRVLQEAEASLKKSKHA